MNLEEQAHEALDRMGVPRHYTLRGVDRAASLAERVLKLRRMFHEAVPKNVWGGR